MAELAITVIGADRPGIIAAVTGALTGVGGNLEDSSMTVLRGHFAMTLIVACAADPADVETALAPVAEQLGLVASVRAVAPSPPSARPEQSYVLTVHGADRPGIVAAVSGCVARYGGNITDLTTRLTGDLYVLTLEVELAGDVGPLAAELSRVATELGVDAAVHAAEADVL